MAKCTQEKFDDGTVIDFDDQGRVRNIEYGSETEPLFNEHKSLYQAAQDIQHFFTTKKHKVVPPPAPPETPAEGSGDTAGE
jgi:hypothetical protein